MADIYYLKDSDDQITFEVLEGTTANAATVASKRRSGNTIVSLAVSQPGDNGSIPGSGVGNSSECIGSALIVTTHVLVPRNQNIDDVFDKLSLIVTVHGGVDGDQSYQIADFEKTKFVGTKSVYATKAIKLQGL